MSKQQDGLTVYHDDGRTPHFEKNLTRAQAEMRIREHAGNGFVAIILEDHQ